MISWLQWWYLGNQNLLILKSIHYKLANTNNQDWFPYSYMLSGAFSHVGIWYIENFLMQAQHDCFSCVNVISKTSFHWVHDIQDIFPCRYMISSTSIHDSNVLVRVSIAMKKHHNHSNSNKRNTCNGLAFSSKVLSIIIMVGHGSM